MRWARLHWNREEEIKLIRQLNRNSAPRRRKKSPRRGKRKVKDKRSALRLFLRCVCCPSRTHDARLSLAGICVRKEDTESQLPSDILHCFRSWSSGQAMERQLGRAFLFVLLLNVFQMGVGVGVSQCGDYTGVSDATWVGRWQNLVISGCQRQICRQSMKWRRWIHLGSW